MNGESSASQKNRFEELAATEIEEEALASKIASDNHLLPAGIPRNCDEIRTVVDLARTIENQTGKNVAEDLVWLTVERLSLPWPGSRTRSENRIRRSEMIKQASDLAEA